MKSGASAAAVAAWIVAVAGTAVAQGDAEEPAAPADPAMTDPDAPLTPPPSEVPPAVTFERIAAKGFYTEAGFGAALYIGAAAPHTAKSRRQIVHGPSWNCR